MTNLATNPGFGKQDRIMEGWKGLGVYQLLQLPRSSSFRDVLGTGTIVWDSGQVTLDRLKEDGLRMSHS